MNQEIWQLGQGAAKHEIHPSHEGYLSDLYLVNTLNLLLITAGKQRSVAHEGSLQISAGAKRWQMVLQLGPHEGSSDLYRRISQQRPYCRIVLNMVLVFHS